MPLLCVVTLSVQPTDAWFGARHRFLDRAHSQSQSLAYFQATNALAEKYHSYKPPKIDTEHRLLSTDRCGHIHSARF
jgi:hypothetical protein